MEPGKEIYFISTGRRTGKSVIAKHAEENPPRCYRDNCAICALLDKIWRKRNEG